MMRGHTAVTVCLIVLVGRASAAACSTWARHRGGLPSQDTIRTSARAPSSCTTDAWSAPRELEITRSQRAYVGSPQIVRVLTGVALFVGRPPRRCLDRPRSWHSRTLVLRYWLIANHQLTTGKDAEHPQLFRADCPLIFHP